RRLGGDPDTSGSASGAAHRAWVNVKSAVTGKDDKAILQEVERGEDVAVESYQKALKKDLPADIRALVERQYQGVQENHNRVRDLRDQYQATAK
ncbi:MAG TPA: PA2169 family four-helix-bundle protein, partial [Gammaproteobacteria bacterium]|nr:PA2169 family four-helix-bundle protein [Gammaproteobacteria bacterium]